MGTAATWLVELLGAGEVGVEPVELGEVGVELAEVDTAGVDDDETVEGGTEACEPPLLVHAATVSATVAKPAHAPHRIATG